MVHPIAAYISNTAPGPGLDKGFINSTNNIQTRAYLMHMCSPMMEVAFGHLHNSGAGAEGARPTALVSIMDEHICIKYVRVCVSCLGLMNPLSRPGQGAVLDMYAAVEWTTRIPAQAHIGYGPAVGWLFNIPPTKGMIPTG